MLRSLQSTQIALGNNGERRGSSAPATNRVPAASVPYQVLMTGKACHITMSGGGCQGSDQDVRQSAAVRISVYNPTGMVTSSVNDFSVEVNCFNMVVSATDSISCNGKYERPGGVATRQQKWFSV